MEVEFPFSYSQYGDGCKYHYRYTVDVTEKNNEYKARIKERYYVFEKGNAIRAAKPGDCSFGTPSQVNALFKKFGKQFDCASVDKQYIDSAIAKYKRAIFNERKDAFLDDLKALLKKHELTLKLKQDGGGWGEAWANSEVIIEDKKSKESFGILDADLEDDEMTFQVE